MYQEIVYPYIESDLNTIPIPLVTIKRYLKLPTITDEDLDADLTIMCQTALEYAEKYCRQIFAERTITTNRVFWGNLGTENYKTILHFAEHQ